MNSKYCQKIFYLFSNRKSSRATYVWDTEQNQEKIGLGMSSLSYRDLRA